MSNKTEIIKQVAKEKGWSIREVKTSRLKLRDFLGLPF